MLTTKLSTILTQLYAETACVKWRSNCRLVYVKWHRSHKITDIPVFLDGHCVTSMLFSDALISIQATSELEKVRSQLLQETQLRAVAEACLMEERTFWQQAAAAAADTSQRCLHMHEVLNALRYNSCKS